MVDAPAAAAQDAGVIRRELPHGWLLIAQTAHAALSGSFAARWRRTELRPRRSVICGVGRHDEGWRNWERRPKVGGPDHRPLDFPELTLEDNLEIWRAGPASVAADDPYAGLLVSLHGCALMERKLAALQTEPGSGPGPGGPADRIRAYLASQQALRARLIRRHRLPETALGPRLEANLHLLQLLDFLSLLLCWREVRPRDLAFGGPDTPYRLRLIPRESGPGPEPRTAWRVRAALVPWPFGEARAHRFRVPARRVAKIPYDPETLRRALDAPTARTALEVVLEPGGRQNASSPAADDPPGSEIR